MIELPISFVHSKSIMPTKISSSNIGWGLFLMLCIIVSFRLYAYPFYPLLNSDHTLTLLHIHFWKWPQDFYLYGQDRMGNLIPLLARPLYLLGMPVLWAEAIIQYGIYIAGFFAWSSFLKTNKSKVVFAIWWFFPNNRLINMVDFSFGTMIALFGMAWYFLFRFTRSKAHIGIIAYILFASLAIWVNDIAIFFISSTALMVTFFLYKKYDMLPSFSLKYWIGIHTVWTIVLGSVLYYFKSKAITNYSGSATLLDIKSSMEIFLQSLQEIFTAARGNYYEMIFSIVAVLMGVFILRKVIKIKDRDVFIYILLSTLFLSLIGIFGSKFTLLNNVPRRYFTLPFFCIFMLFVYIWERDNKASKWWTPIVVIGIIFGSISTQWEMKYLYPKTLKPKAELIAELNPNNRIVVIGNYWHSLVYSAINPDKVYSVVYEGDLLRDWAMVERFQTFDTIYVNREKWMDSFPDSLYQYGSNYVRFSDEFEIAESKFSIYIKQP